MFYGQPFYEGATLLFNYRKIRLYLLAPLKFTGVIFHSRAHLLVFYEVRLA